VFNGFQTKDRSLLTIANHIIRKWSQAITINYLNSIFLISTIQKSFLQISKHLKRLPKALGYPVFLSQEKEMKNSMFDINEFIEDYYNGFFKRFSKDF